MAENSGIEWTDHTFNPWIGCSKVHTGCTNCYAEEMMDKRYHRVQWGPNGTRSLTATWNEPPKWNRDAEREGVRKRVFCASLADVFEDWKAPLSEDLTIDDARKRLFQLIDETPMLDWLLLTKRPENIRKMWHGGRRHNVWLGTSISDQETAGAAMKLLACRDLSPVLFLSCEPIVGPIDLTKVETWDGYYDVLSGSRLTQPHDTRWCLADDLGFRYPSIDWVIVGGESGPDARPCDHVWLEYLKEQCADKAFWMKQLGVVSTVPSKGKGEHIEDWPESLRVQQLPGVNGEVY